MTRSLKIRPVLIIIFVLLLLPSLSFSKEEEMSKEEYVKGIASLREQLKGEPKSPVLHNTLGYYLYKVGKFESAEKEYSDAIMYDKKYPVPYNNLGILALQKKDYELAETYFTDAVDLNPKYAKAVYNLGVAYFRQKKYVKAARCYLKAKRVDEEYVNERESSKKGEEELKKALKDDPDNEVLKYMLEKRYEEEK